MRQAGRDRHGHRLGALIVVLWRAGLPINEALSLTETDLDRRRGSILVRHAKNDRRREAGRGRVGVDAWAWTAIEPWLADRLVLPVGPLFCVIDGPTRGRAWSASAVRVELRHLALKAGVRRRLAPHQLRHAHAVEMSREGVPLLLYSGNSGMPISGSRVPARDRQHRDRPRRSERPAPMISATTAFGSLADGPETEVALRARRQPPANHQAAPTALPAE